MKTNTFFHVTRQLAMVAFAALGSGTFAAQTWDLNALCKSTKTNYLASDGTTKSANKVNSSTTSLNNCGNTTSSAVGLATSGWSTGTGTQSAPTDTDNKFKVADVYDWGTNGLGVVSKNEFANPTGPHATDSKYGTEAELFKFDSAVNLTSLKLGWNGTDNGGPYADSDLSVLVWTGVDVPPVMLDLNVTTALSAPGSKWKLVGNYLDVGFRANSSQTFNTAINSDGSALYSKYWLISTYNSAYGGTPDSTADSFKLLLLAADVCTKAGGVTGTTCGGTVPEPGSLALLGVGLLGMMAVRRRKASANT